MKAVLERGDLLSHKRCVFATFLYLYSPFVRLRSCICLVYCNLDLLSWEAIAQLERLYEYAEMFLCRNCLCKSTKSSRFITAEIDVSVNIDSK
jgi:hypothetical protein